MNELQKMFPSLALFSDIDWDLVTKEYQENYIDISFPEYLQEKALDGDCPPYLFELAFFEMALADVRLSESPFPHLPGIYLNPNALFLSLEFDIRRMLKEAAQGEINVYEREHVLCIYRNPKGQVHFSEMSETELDLLQHLEDGVQTDPSFIKDMSLFRSLVDKGVILDLLTTPEQLAR